MCKNETKCAILRRSYLYKLLIWYIDAFALGAMMKKLDFIWLDGKLLPWDEAKVHFLTHTLHYGNGAFEGLRGYLVNDGKDIAIFRLQDHTKRLLESCKIAAIKCPYNYDELINAQIELIRSNKKSFSSGIYLRPLVFLGYGTMGLTHINAPVQVGIAAWEWGAYLGEEALKNGVRVKTSSITRNSIKSNMNKAKLVANYLNSQLAKYEALECGYEEALLLDDTGLVAEGSGECIFIVRDNELITPTHTSSLESITQKTTIEIAKDLGFKITQRQVTRDEIYISDEAFFTGTAVEITPINSLDSRIIGSGKVGKITKAIQEAYFDVVNNKNAKYAHYLTII